MLSKTRVEELQRIMKEEYGKEMSYSEAHNFGTKLVGYFDLLVKIDHRVKKEEQQKRFFAERLARILTSQVNNTYEKSKNT